jgi:hypothetical protein
MGSEADADSKIREAVHLMEMALPKLHPGGDKYKACIESLQRLSKQFPASAEVPGVQDTQLLQLMQRAKQSAMMQAAQRQQQAQGGAPGGGAMGGGPPPAMGGAGGPPPGGPPG